MGRLRLGLQLLFAKLALRLKTFALGFLACQFFLALALSLFAFPLLFQPPLLFFRFSLGLFLTTLLFLGFLSRPFLGFRLRLFPRRFLFTRFPGFPFPRLGFLAFLLLLLLQSLLLFLALLLGDTTGFFLLPLPLSLFPTSLFLGPTLLVALLLIVWFNNRAGLRLLLGNQTCRYASGWRLVVGTGPRPTRQRNTQNQRMQRDGERHR